MTQAARAISMTFATGKISAMSHGRPIERLAPAIASQATPSVSRRSIGVCDSRRMKARTMALAGQTSVTPAGP
jgi:hypothetical protein